MKHSLLITLFARKEPTTDPLTKTMDIKGKMDTVIYRDALCTQRVVRWPWHLSNCPDRRYKRITLNCWKWNLQWVPSLQAASI